MEVGGVSRGALVSLSRVADALLEQLHFVLHFQLSARRGVLRLRQRQPSRCRCSALLGRSSHATPPVPPPEFALEQRVRVKGLSQRAELNGLAGVVLAYDGANERYTVQLSGQPKAMAMRKQHLETDDAPVEGVSTTAA